MMKSLAILLFAALLVGARSPAVSGASPTQQPPSAAQEEDAVQGARVVAPASGSVEFVGNSVVDLRIYEYSAYDRDDFDYFQIRRDNAEIARVPNPQDKTLYRDSNLTKGQKYTYQICKVFKSKAATCFTPDSVTTGEVRGTLYQSLAWTGGSYTLHGHVDVETGATLTIPAGAVVKGHTDNSYHLIAYKGAVRIDGATINDLHYVSMAGNGSLQGATLNSTPVDVRVTGPGTFTISDNQFIASQLDVDLKSKADLVVSNNTFVRCGAYADSEDPDGGATFRQNKFQGNFQPSDDRSYVAGIGVSGGTALIEANDFSQECASGSFISVAYDCAGATVRNNYIEITGLPDSENSCGWDGAGIHIYEASPSCQIAISGNVIKQLSAGIKITTEAGGAIAGNTILSPRASAIEVWGNSPVEIRQNCLIGGAPTLGGAGGLMLYEGGSSGYPERTQALDARNNWWGHPTGPRYHGNPSGEGSMISALAGKVLFEPWLTADNCREKPAGPPKAGKLTLDLPPAPVLADGKTQIDIVAHVEDELGVSLPNAKVSFTLSPAVGSLSATSATTGPDGKATVKYTVPSLADLSDASSVTIQATSGTVRASGTIAFQKPKASYDAEPRFHQDGWATHHALLPPDAEVNAVLEAQFTLNGKPVAGLPVNVAIKPYDGMVDGEFVDALNPVGPIGKERVTVKSSQDGWIRVKYRTNAQASRTSPVFDEVEMRSDAFGYFGAWLVETGMDLQLVEVHRLGEDIASYVVLGQPEQLQIEVRDRLHPSFLLSNYNNTPDPVTDPDVDQFLGVRLDVSHAATQEEFLKLLDIPYKRIPRMLSYNCYFYPASGKVFLFTSDGGNLDNRPTITPWIEGTSIYWLEAQLQLKSPPELVRDNRSPKEDPEAPADPNNNYALVALFSNENLNAWEQFFKDNPCATGNSDYGRTFKCALGILSVLPATQTIAAPAKVALALCEAVFDWANGNCFNASVTAGSALSDDFSIYLNRHPVLKYGTAFSKKATETLAKVSQIDAAVSCYWAVKKAGQNAAVSGCGADVQIMTQAQVDEYGREMDLFVRSLVGSLDAQLDLLAVIGAQEVEVNDGSRVVPVAVDDYAWTEDLAAFSLVKGESAYFLLPRGGQYTVSIETEEDLSVMLFRRGADLNRSSQILWESQGSAERTATLSFGADSVSNMQVGGTTVPPTLIPYVPNPTDVQATQTGDDSVRLSWPGVADAAQYKVYYGVESRYLPLFEGYTQSVTTKQNSVTIEGLDLAFNAYYFGVTAVDAKGHESVWSAQALAGSDTRSWAIMLPFVSRAD